MLKSRTSVAEIPRTIPEDSLFNIENHSARLSQIASENCNLSFPLLLNSFMRRSPLDEIATKKSRTIKIWIERDSFDWLSELDSSVWDTLLVRNYHLAELTERRHEFLHAALDHLRRRHPESYECVRRFVKLIGWLEVTASSEVMVSNGSAPTLPFTVFFSDLGMRQMPPKTVATEDSVRILAENLLHEATHQRITFHLLEHEVLKKDFDTKTSRKINIGWREGLPHSQWEPDRVLHAAIVYNEVLRYRMRELRDPDCEESARRAFCESTAAGAKSIIFLTESLLGVKDHFSEYGAELIDGQVALASAAATEWEANRAWLQ